jgi:hypothetical protein
MAVVRVMQMAVDKIIHMVAMRHCRVATIRSVHVICSVATAHMASRTAGGIGVGHVERMFLDHSISGLMV